MIADWDQSFQLTEKWEGWHQFSKTPGDPGGATWCGLTQGEYDEWRRANNKFTQFVRLASDDEVKAIFKTQYWDQVRADELPAGLDYLLFDIAINMGPRVAIKFLQEAVQTDIDGWFGLGTMGAMKSWLMGHSTASVIHTIASRRMSYWHSLITWWRFGKGWSSRGIGSETEALAMASGHAA